MRTQATRSFAHTLQRTADRTSAKLDEATAAARADLRDLADALSPRRAFIAMRTFAPRWVVNIAVAGMVLSLPLAAAAAPEPGATLATGSSVPSAATARAAALSRGSTIAAGRAPITVNAEGVRPIIEYTLSANDTLTSLANFFNVSPEAIAFANGISDPDLAGQAGRSIRIPPGQGALYTVAEGDTLDSVAQRFKVEPAVIKDYNRLHFEPEHFAPGKLIFVPGAALPGLVVVAADPAIERPETRIAPAPALRPVAVAPTGDGTLAFPVAGIITQHFHGGHTGVDIAAPYGSTIIAPAAGTVSAVGWVPVGGLRVCIAHAGGLESCSYHTAAVFVSVGQVVERGHPVASIGMTGVTTGPHVHFEVKRGGAFVNPLSVIR